MTMKARLEELSSKRQTALAKASELLEAADKSDDGLTDDITRQIDELTAKAEEIDGQINAALAQEAATKLRLERINNFSDHSDAIASARGVHVPGMEPANATKKLPAVARVHGRLDNFKDDVNGVRAEERAFRFGQWALAKMSMDIPKVAGQFRQACAFARDQFGMAQPFAAHYEGGSDTTGAHIFVPDEFVNDLIRLREVYGVARRALRVRNMSSDTLTVPRRTGGLTAYFVGEAAQITESSAGYDSVKLTAEKLGAIAIMSSELNEDSVIDFADELAGEVSYAFSNKEDDCLFNGDGTSTYGGMTGVITQLDTLTAATAPGLVDGTGTGWAGLTLANFEDVVGNLPQYADVPGQVAWYCHKAFAWSVMKRLALAAGGNTADDITGGPGMSFLGYPVVISQVMPSATNNDHIPVVFGNLNMAAKMGSRREVQIDFSTEATVNSQNLFEQDLMAVRGTQRFDIVVHDFGTGTVAGPVIGLETNA